MHSTANPPGINILYWSVSLQLLKNSQAEVESFTTQDVACEHALQLEERESKTGNAGAYPLGSLRLPNNGEFVRRLIKTKPYNTPTGHVFGEIRSFKPEFVRSSISNWLSCIKEIN